MFKQLLFGFKGKTLPFSIMVGLTLLTISVYEAIYGLAGIMTIGYILPGLILLIVAVTIFMLSFVTYEYRFMYNNLTLRKVVFGKTSGAISFSLDDKDVSIETSQSDLFERTRRFYLPFFGGKKKFKICYIDEEGKNRTIIFKPSRELMDMIENYMKARESV